VVARELKVSTLMLRGILGMPMPDELEDLDFITYTQFLQAAREAGVVIDELEQQNERLQERYIQLVTDLANSTTEIANLTVSQQKTLFILTSILNSKDVSQMQEAIRSAIMILNGKDA
jgi:hypothetical protein